MRSRPARLVARLVPLTALLLGGATRARADQPAPGGADPTVAVVTGDRVNLRVGPRVDDAEVIQLDQGAVLVIVERAGEWLGVQVPAGFSGAVHSQFVELSDDRDHVKVVGTEVNLRRGAGTEYPAFRDRLRKDAVLPVLAREGDWFVVEAPEEIRAYVSSKYVKEVGPVDANAERLAAGRESRAARERLRGKAAVVAKGEGDDGALRQELGTISKTLMDLRAVGGYDVAPIAALEDRLDEAIKTRAGATPRALALAKVLLEDLRRETEIRVAYADEILAKKRTGQPAPTAARPPADRKDAVEVTGFIRWEPAPGWDGGGAFVLWVGDKPANALRWASGDIKSFATDRPVKVKGRQLGGRLLGLPTIEIDSLTTL